MRRLLLLLLVAASGAAAQPHWRTVEPALGGAIALDGGFGPEWEAGTGVVARLEAPAYGGHARIALRVAPYEPDRADLPEFTAVAPSLGWGLGAGLPGGLRLLAGPQVGVLHLRFDDEDGQFGGNLQNETELMAGAWGRLEAPLTRRVRLWTEGEVSRVAFANPAVISTASAGLAVRLDTPRWLRGLLE